MSKKDTHRPGTTILRRLVALVFGFFLVLQAGLVYPHSNSVLPHSTPVAEAQTSGSTASPQTSSSTPSLQDTGTTKCGSSFALVFDLSNSLSASDIRNLKDSTTKLVNGLAGAPYNVGVYTFATNAPAYGQQNLPATSLADPAGVQAVLKAIEAVTLPGGNYGGTNWEGGLGQVADDMASGINYDTVYFITDGTPTFDNQGSNYRGDSTEDKEVSNAVAQRPRIEQLGGRVIPVGVGSDLFNNVRVPIYTRPTVYSSWRFGYYSTTKTLLGQITTSGQNAVIVPDYSQLPTSLQKNVVTGCLQIVKNIVDSNGKVLKKGGGWTFDLSSTPTSTPVPGSITTNADGMGEISVKDIGNSPVAVTIKERSQSGFELVTQNSHDASCMAYQHGAQPTPVSITGDPGKGINLNLDPVKIITCTFNNVPVVPVTLTKQVAIGDSQLLTELNNTKYNFAYECELNGTLRGKGNFTDVKPGDPQSLGNYPLGTECKITEASPQIDANRFTVKTSWDEDNAGAVSTSSDGLTHTIKPDSNAYLGGSGARVRATNTFEAVNGTITLRKNIVHPELLPQDRIPAKFPVKYTCRYVTSAEAAGGAQGTPYYVGNGDVVIDRNGSVQIGPFPVGTECNFQEVAPDGNPGLDPGISGFSLQTTWNSDMCTGAPGNTGSSLPSCPANFVRIPSKGDHKVEVSNSYTRQTGKFEINKELTGDAASAGTDTSYKFDVHCTDGGQAVFDKTGVVVKSGAGTMVRDVPVGADCVVSEQTPSIDNVNVTVPGSKTVRLAKGDDTQSVTFTNELTYRKGAIRLTKTVDLSQITDEETVQQLKGEVFPVQATCRVPGQDEPQVHNENMTNGSVFTIPNLPIGSSCTFAETYTAPEGVEYSSAISTGSSTILLTSESGADATVKNTFRPAAGGIRVTKYIDDALVPADLSGQVPKTYTVNYRCSSGQSGTLNLTPGNEQSISGVPPQDTCTFTEQSSTLPAGLEQKETWRTDGVNPQEGDTAQVRILPGKSVRLTLNNSFTPTFSEVSLTKKLVFQGADGQPVSSAVAQAYAQANPQFPVDYKCERNGDVVANGATSISQTEGSTMTVPTGSTCTFTERPPLISGTTGPDASYSGGDKPSDGSVVITPQTPNDKRNLTVTNTYKVKYSGFNLKKKIDGEGLSAISSDRKYEVDYHCSLNGVEVASGSKLISRFQSGTDNQIQGIPAGAECTVSEKADGENGAAEPYAQVSNRWAVTDGPTGRDNEKEEVCAAHEGCDNTDHQNEVKITMLPDDEDGFLGTVVVWNTYVFDKVDVSVDKVLTGDGQELAGDKDFNFTLVCSDPDFFDSDLGNQEDVAIVDPTQRQYFTITGQGSKDRVLRVPMGYICNLVEQQVDGYDATVKTHFSGPDVETTSDQDPTGENGASSRFTIAGEFANSDNPQKITVTNDYARPRASLALSKVFGDHPNSVAPWLTSSSFPVSWTCEDPYTSKKFEGTGNADAGGDAIRVDNLPASAVCSVSEDVEGKVPAGQDQAVRRAYRVESFDGPISGDADRMHPGTSMSDLTLTPNKETNVRFTNTYWVHQIQLHLAKKVEGDQDNKILGKDFQFTYHCEYPNLLPGQPVPFEPDGTATVADDGLWTTPYLPDGSSCEVSEKAPDGGWNLPAGWRLQQNYVNPTGDAPIQVDEHGNPVVNDDSYKDDVRIPLNDGDKIKLGGDKPTEAVMFNSLFRADGEVQVFKVDTDGNPLTGAKFAIYGTDGSGNMTATPVADNLEFIKNPDGSVDESKFTTRLTPGTYYLVETKAGNESQLLPTPWQFSVVPDEDNPDNPQLGNLKFVLESKAENSGLVELVPPKAPEGGQLDGTEPWVIKVANVAMGEMPLTGRQGLAGLIGGGIAVLVLAAGWWVWGRRRE